jgi:hypothetical protein
MTTKKEVSLVLEVSAESGIETERELTSAEVLDRKKIHDDFIGDWETHAAAKASAQAKLKKLGLTAAEIEAL